MKSNINAVLNHINPGFKGRKVDPYFNTADPVAKANARSFRRANQQLAKKQAQRIEELQREMLTEYLSKLQSALATHGVTVCDDN
jgi:hypothetical protein